jgi:hypothetical protein
MAAGAGAPMNSIIARLTSSAWVQGIECGAPLSVTSRLPSIIAGRRAEVDGYGKTRSASP